MYAPMRISFRNGTAIRYALSVMAGARPPAHKLSVARPRTDDVGEPALERGNDTLGIIDRQGRLRDVGDRRVRRQVERIDLGLVLHQEHRARNLAHGALDLGVAGVTDQDELAPLADI